MGGRSGRQRTTPRAELRRYALGLPGAHEDFPWGESVVKVGKKVFVFLGRSGSGLSLSVKLPSSNLLALDLPFTSPTGYGLARGGWVTAQFEGDEGPPLDLLRQWVEESYRAVAPRRLVQLLDAEMDSRSGGGEE
jgi:predicted DNA-binding protein (MmcQ/YjbR family)